MGLDPATRPLLRGRVYALRAFDASHAEKRVLVDARSGEVLSVRAVADTGPAEEPYNPRYGHYEPPRPPARVANVPGAEPILDEPLFPRAGRGAPAAAPSKQSAALTSPPPALKVQPPAPAAGRAQDNKVQDNKPDNNAEVGTSPVSTGETASSSLPAAPLASADVLAAAPSAPGKSIPAPVAAKPDSAKPATQFVPVAPLE